MNEFLKMFILSKLHVIVDGGRQPELKPAHELLHRPNRKPGHDDHDSEWVWIDFLSEYKINNYTICFVAQKNVANIYSSPDSGLAATMENHVLHDHHVLRVHHAQPVPNQQNPQNRQKGKKINIYASKT